MRRSAVLALLAAAGAAALDPCVPTQGAPRFSARGAASNASAPVPVSYPSPVGPREVADAFPTGFFPHPEAHPAYDDSAPDTNDPARLQAATKCCSLAGFNSFCASSSDDDGVVVDFDLDTSAPPLLGARAAPPLLRGENTSGQVSLKAFAPPVNVISTGNTGRQTYASYTLNAFPTYKIARALVTLNWRDAEDECTYHQTIGGVGGVVGFDVDTDCTRVCSDRTQRNCAPVVFCAKSVPSPTGGLATRFHFGVADAHDATRAIDLAMLEAKTEFETYQMAISTQKGCSFPLKGTPWSARAKVRVVANPSLGRYVLILEDLYADANGIGFHADTVIVPPLRRP
jgi:hypothetical protein